MSFISEASKKILVVLNECLKISKFFLRSESDIPALESNCTHRITPKYN